MPRGFEGPMIPKFLAILLLSLSAVPALAKSDPNYFPISCDALWTAVKGTLNPADYNVVGIDDLNYRASFYVVGDFGKYKDWLILRSQDQGCSIKLNISQIGSDNSNERSFRGRLKRTLARMQRSQPPLSIGGGVSTASTSGPAAQPSASPVTGVPAKPQGKSGTPVAQTTWDSTLTSQIVLASPVAIAPVQPRSEPKPVGGSPSSGVASL